MAIKQTIWSLNERRELAVSALQSEDELEGLLADNIGLLSDDWLVVGRQVRTDYGGYIDLLCIDMGGNPIVVELKKAMTPREVTAQALDYASWVKEISAETLAEIFLRYTGDTQSLNEAFYAKFGTNLEERNDDTTVQIVIVATQMDGSTERIIRFLQGFDIDINVLFFSVFEHQGKRLLSRAWMVEPGRTDIPQPGAAHNWNGEFYFSFGDGESRAWADAMRYGFVSAGGKTWYTRTLRMLEPGSRIWVNIPQVGYVGVGTVTETAMPAQDAALYVDGQKTPFFDLPLSADYHRNMPPEKGEAIVAVDWHKAVPRAEAVSEYGFFGNQNIVCRPKSDKWTFTIKRLTERWHLEDL